MYTGKSPEIPYYQRQSISYLWSHTIPVIQHNPCGAIKHLQSYQVPAELLSTCGIIKPLWSYQAPVEIWSTNGTMKHLWKLAETVSRDIETLISKQRTLNPQWQSPAKDTVVSTGFPIVKTQQNCILLTDSIEESHSLKDLLVSVTQEWSQKALSHWRSNPYKEFNLLL